MLFPVDVLTMIKYAESMFAIEFGLDSICYHWYEKGRAHSMKVVITKVNFSGGEYYYDHDVYFNIVNLPTAHIFTSQLFRYVIESSYKYRRPVVNRQFYLTR